MNRVEVRLPALHPGAEARAARKLSDLITCLNRVCAVETLDYLLSLLLDEKARIKATGLRRMTHW
jgi:hypothetical protein